MLQFRSNLYCLVFDFLCLLSIPAYAFFFHTFIYYSSVCSHRIKIFLLVWWILSLPLLSIPHHITSHLFLPSQLGIILSPFLIILHYIIPPSPQHCTQLSFLPEASPPQQSSLIGAPFFPSKIGRNPGEDSGSGVAFSFFRFSRKWGKWSWILTLEFSALSIMTTLEGKNIRRWLKKGRDRWKEWMEGRRR